MVSFENKLLTPLDFGHALLVNGRLGSNPSRFSINLAYDVPLRDWPFHLVFFNTAAGGLHKNTAVGGKWLTGESHEMQLLHPGGKFKLYIFVGANNRFHVSLNDTKLTEYTIQGDLKMNLIKYLTIIKPVDTLIVEQLEHRILFPNYPFIDVLLAQTPWKFFNHFPISLKQRQIVTFAGVVKKSLLQQQDQISVKCVPANHNCNAPTDKTQMKFIFGSRENQHSIASDQDQTSGSITFALDNPAFMTDSKIEIAFGFGDNDLFFVGVNGKVRAPEEWTIDRSAFLTVGFVADWGMDITIESIDNVMGDSAMSLENFQCHLKIKQNV